MSTANTSESLDWQAVLTQTYQELFQQIQQLLPQLFMAILVVLAGLLTALVLRFLAHRLIYGFDWLYKLVRRAGTAQEGADRQRAHYAAMASRFTFWLVLVLFITAAANVLGWSLFAGWLQKLIDYLPRLVIGIGIITLAFVFGDLIRSAVNRAVDSMGIEYGPALGRLAQLMVLLAAIVIGVQQLGLDVSFLTILFIVVVGVLLFGLALAFALGAKTFIANLIGMQVVRQYCQPGEYLQIGDINGVVVELSQTAVVLDGKHGRIMVPGSLLQAQVSVSSHEVPNEQSLFGNLFQKKDADNE